MPDGTSISISPFSTAGVRKIVFNEQENADDYDIICVPVNAEQIETIEKFFEDTKGDGYDWPGMIPQPSSRPSKPAQGLVPKAGAADEEESEQASAKTADRRANDESVLLSPPPPRHGTLGEGARGRGGQLRAGLGGRGRGEEGGLTHRFGHHCQQPVL